MKNGKKAYIIITFTYLILGVLFRLIYLNQFSLSPLFNHPFGPDVQEYDNWAKSILCGELLWTDVHIHAPLYSYFLAFLYWLLSIKFFWIRFIQLIINLIAGLPIAWLITHNNPDSDNKCRQRLWTGALFLLAWALYPPFVFYHAELISESLSVPLLCWAIFFLYLTENNNKDRFFKVKPVIYALVAGIIAGMAVIAHPFTMLFVIGEIIFLLSSNIRHKKFKNLIYTGVFIFSVLLLPAGISIYNSSISGKLTFVQQNSGFNFYLGNNTNATGLCYLRPGPTWDSVHRDAEKKSSATGISKDDYFLGKSFDFILSHPMKWAWITTCKAVYVFNWRELPAGADVWPILYFTPVMKYSIWAFGFIAILAILGITGNYDIREFRHKYRHFFILLICFWVAQTLFVTSGRYRLAMIPALIIFAAEGIIFFLTKIKSSEYYPRLILCLIISFFIVILPTPPLNKIKQKAEADTILGEALMSSGQDKKANEYFENSAKIMPQWSRNWNLIGIIAENENHFAKAENCFIKAIECNPNSPYGFLNMATYNSNLTNNRKAEKYFQMALKKGPQSPEVLYNYALFLQKKGQNTEAELFYRKSLKFNPSFVKSLNNLGNLMVSSGKPIDAVKLFDKALRLDPKNPHRLLNLAVAYFATGNRQKAEQYAKKALSINPDLKEAKMLLAK